MGLDFTLIVPLLPSHCGFSSVLGCGVSSLVKSGVFLSMVVQQPVVILVLSQEGVRVRPSTLPSWLILSKISSQYFQFLTYKIYSNQKVDSTQCWQKCGEKQTLISYL